MQNFFFVMMGVFAALLFTSGEAANFVKPKPRPEPVAILTDIVKVINLEARKADGSAIRPGDQIEVVMTIQNVSSRQLPKVMAVISQVSPQPAPAGNSCTRYRDNVSPNEIFTLPPCTMTAAANGQITFRGEISDARTPEVRETFPPDRANNSKDVTITAGVAVIGGGTGGVTAVAPIVEAWLDPQQASRSRGGYNMAMMSGVGSGPCDYIQNTYPDHIEVGVDCRTTDPRQLRLQGEVRDFMLYRNITLRNGWTVVRIETPELNDSGRWAGSRITQAPQAGSTVPYAELRIRAEAGHMKKDTIRIRIQGPQDKSPY